MDTGCLRQSGHSASLPAGEEEPCRVLLLPGLDNSGPEHWQSRWEALPDFRRVDFGDWGAPRLHEWVPRLDRAVRECPRPLVFAAHSLGCLAVAWWAALCWVPAFAEKVLGALLVAPPDVDSLEVDRRLRDFRPIPRGRLPFRSIVVASRTDPYSTFARSAGMARAWGSELADCGPSGHINAASSLGDWFAGLRLLSELSGHDRVRLAEELRPRTAATSLPFILAGRGAQDRDRGDLLVKDQKPPAGLGAGPEKQRR